MPSMSMSLCLREVLQPLLRPLSPKPQLPPAGPDAAAAAATGYPASPAVASATDAARRPGRHRRGCG
jgi:hypothetical protein